MGPRLLDPDVQRFLRDYENADERELLLSGRVPPGVAPADIARQLAGRKKARTKLPLWYNNTAGVLFPPSLNLEQCSSEITGRFKAMLAKEWLTEPHRGADLTLGFGVDSYFLSHLFGEWHAVEPDEDLLNTTIHNHRLLSAYRIRHHLGTAEDFLAREHGKFDLILVDPSRRTGSQRTIQLSDHEPDVIKIQDRLWSMTRHLLIKASPMLDLSRMAVEIRHLTHLIVVAVNNEVKELLGWAQKDFSGRPSIAAVYLTDSDSLQASWAHRFEFTREEESLAPATLGPVTRYVYEPWTSLLKAGAFKLIAQRYDLTKLDTSTHLYTSNELRSDFPGRVFEVVATVKIGRQAGDLFGERQANIISRNHPLSVAELSSKTNLTEGGTEYLLAFRAGGKPMAVKAIRIR